MKILFLSDNFPPEVNAPASRTFEHCRRWVTAGHEVTVITCAPNFPRGKIFPGYKNHWQKWETMEGIRILRVWSYIAPNKGFTRRILDYVSYMTTAILASPSTGKADVVIGTSPQFFTVCAAWVVSCLKRAPFVFELRDLWPESIRTVGAMKDGIAIRLLEQLELFLYRRSSAVISVTRSFKKNLIDRGIAPEKISIVTNGVDLERFQPKPKHKSLETSLGLEGKLVAGYIGTHGMAHDLGTVLEAAGTLLKHPKGADFHFLFLGDGADKIRLEKFAKEKKLSNVTFIDSVPKEDVPNYWSLLDISIIHLRRTDLFKMVIPSKIFECMGMGIPILLGVEGESAEILNETQVGRTFTPSSPKALADSLIDIITNRKCLDSWSANGPKAALTYDRNSLASEMEKILLKLPKQVSS